jgi:hypothetical protein
MNLTSLIKAAALIKASTWGRGRGYHQPYYGGMNPMMGGGYNPGMGYGYNPMMMGGMGGMNSMMGGYGIPGQGGGMYGGDVMQNMLPYSNQFHSQHWPGGSQTNWGNPAAVEMTNQLLPHYIGAQADRLGYAGPQTLDQLRMPNQAFEGQQNLVTQLQAQDPSNTAVNFHQGVAAAPGSVQSRLAGYIDPEVLKARDAASQAEEAVLTHQNMGAELEKKRNDALVAANRDPVVRSRLLNERGEGNFSNSLLNTFGQMTGYGNNDLRAQQETASAHDAYIKNYSKERARRLAEATHRTNYYNSMLAQQREAANTSGQQQTGLYDATLGSMRNREANRNMGFSAGQHAANTSFNNLTGDINPKSPRIPQGPAPQTPVTTSNPIHTGPLANRPPMGPPAPRRTDANIPAGFQTQGSSSNTGTMDRLVSQASRSLVTKIASLSPLQRKHLIRDVRP